jgi:aspartate aminotransferase-like enzyme
VRQDKLLMIPGPSVVPSRVLRALSEPPIGHRTAEFRALLEEVTRGLKEVFRTQNDVFVLSSSGTGAMEAAVANTVNPGDRVLVVVIGHFGERWVKLVSAYGAQVERLDFEWGQAADPDVLRSRLRQPDADDIRTVLLTQNETSTGVCNDVEALAAVVREHGALLIVDAISGLLGIELRTDEWGVDIVVGGSQKAFMLPPGLAFISVSDRAWEAVARCRQPRFYFDLPAARKALEDWQTPYTPAVNLFVGLREALRMAFEEGLDNIHARHRRLGRATRAAVQALGLQLLADPQRASDVVTAVRVPEGVDGSLLSRTMSQDYDITITGGQGALKGRIFRIGHVGHVFERDVLATLAALELALHKVGFPTQLGVGVAAAQKEFAEQ